MTDSGSISHFDDMNTSDLEIFTVEFRDVDDPPTISTIDDIDANEGGVTLSWPIYVDEGGDSGEDLQKVTIKVESDNTIILPLANIAVYYDVDDDGLADASELQGVADNGAGEVNEISINDDIANSSAHKILLKLTPVGGESGEVKITVSAIATDLIPGTFIEGTYPQQEFTFTVHPVSALHGGWKHISAVSTKTDKDGNLLNGFICPYSFEHCDTGTTHCIGNGSPADSVVAR